MSQMTAFMSPTTNCGGRHNNCHARLIKQGLIAAQDTNFVTDETEELAIGTVWDTRIGTCITHPQFVAVHHRDWNVGRLFQPLDSEADADSLACFPNWVSSQRFFASRGVRCQTCGLLRRLPHLLVEIYKPVGLSQTL